jgi:hypothetical protein
MGLIEDLMRSCENHKSLEKQQDHGNPIMMGGKVSKTAPPAVGTTADAEYFKGSAKERDHWENFGCGGWWSDWDIPVKKIGEFSDSEIKDAVDCLKSENQDAPSFSDAARAYENLKSLAKQHNFGLDSYGVVDEISEIDDNDFAKLTELLKDRCPAITSISRYHMRPFGMSDEEFRDYVQRESVSAASMRSERLSYLTATQKSFENRDAMPCRECPYSEDVKGCLGVLRCTVSDDKEPRKHSSVCDRGHKRSTFGRSRNE